MDNNKDKGKTAAKDKDAKSKLPVSVYQTSIATYVLTWLYLYFA